MALWWWAIGEADASEYFMSILAFCCWHLVSEKLEGDWHFWGKWRKKGFASSKTPIIVGLQFISCPPKGMWHTDRGRRKRGVSKQIYFAFSCCIFSSRLDFSRVALNSAASAWARVASARALVVAWALRASLIAFCCADAFATSASALSLSRRAAASCHLHKYPFEWLTFATSWEWNSPYETPHIKDIERKINEGGMLIERVNWRWYVDQDLNLCSDAWARNSHVLTFIDVGQLSGWNTPVLSLLWLKLASKTMIQAYLFPSSDYISLVLNFLLNLSVMSSLQAC